MRPRLVAVVAAGFFFVAVAYNLRGSPQQTTAAPQAPPASGAAERQAVLSKYCFMCHNEKLKSGGLALSTLDLANLSKNPEKWEKVIRKLRTGAMPPAKMPRPDKATGIAASARFFASRTTNPDPQLRIRMTASPSSTPTVRNTSPPGPTRASRGGG